MHTVTITKDFPVPVAQLFHAWTNPEALKQWWHPMGNQLTHVTNELAEGGTLRYQFRNGETDDVIEITGQYETVKPAEHLVYSWIWHLPHLPVGNGDYKLNIVFTAAGSGSRLEVRQENFGSEEAVQPHREGWEKALNDLEAHLTQQAASE